MRNIYTLIFLLILFASAAAQNIGINTDGTAAETGVMLDVKGTNAITTTATQNIFQLKSLNTSGTELKMRMILGTHATAGSRYGALEVYDAGAAAYRHLSLQPNGGNVGIGTTSPWTNVAVEKNQNSGTQVSVSNTDAGTSAWGGFSAYNNNSGTGALYAGMAGTGFTFYPLFQNRAFVEAAAGTDGLLLVTDNAADPILFATGLTERMRIAGNGNVGIGETVPAEKLHVTGNVRATSLAGTGTVVVAADPNGTLQRTTISTGSSGGSCCSGWTLKGVLNSTKADIAVSTDGVAGLATAGKEYLLVAIYRTTDFTLATTDAVALVQTTIISPSSGYSTTFPYEVSYDYNFVSSVAGSVDSRKIYYCVPFLNGSSSSIVLTNFAFLTNAIRVGLKGDGTFYIYDGTSSYDMGIYIFER